MSEKINPEEQVALPLPNDHGGDHLSYNDEEFVPPPPLPSVAFAEHVERVRIEGDPARNGPMCSNWSRHDSRMMAVGGLSAAIGIFSIFPSVAAPFVYRSFKKEIKEYAEIAREQLNEPAQFALNQEYELYGRYNGQRKLTLRWYGPFESEIESPRQSADYLLKMAKLAEENGVERFAVDKDVLEALHLPTQIKDAETLGLSRFLENRGIHIRKKPDEQQVLVAETHIWLQEIEAFKKGQQLPRMQLFMNVLREANPDHPLVAIYDEYREFPEQLNEKLRQRTAEALKRRLTEPTAISTRDSLMHADAPDGLAKKRKVISQANPLDDGMNVVWKAGESELGRESILTALGLRQDELESLLTNPTAQPTKSQKLVELLLHNMTRDSHDFMPVIEGQADEESFTFDHYGPMTQEILTGAISVPSEKKLNYIISPMWRLSRMIGASAIAYWALFLPAQATGLPELVGQEMSQVKKHVADFLPGFTPDGAASDSGNLLGIVPDAGIAAEASSSFDGTPASDHPVEILYSLDARGLFTRGYWTQLTSRTVQVDVSTEGQNMSWHPISKYSAVYRVPKISATNESYIDVSRDIKFNPLHHVKPESAFRIPVREGTAPVAAQLGDQALDVVQFDGGAYGLRIPDTTRLKGKERLVYRLQQIDNAPYAVSSVVGASPMVSWAELDGDAIDAYWRRTHPEFSIIPSVRAKQLATHIRTYKYVLSPSQSNVFVNSSYMSAIVERVDQQRLVNCFVANSINIISNPDELNYAGGFMNGNGDRYLTSRERHAWGVNKAHQKIDATPASDSPELRAYFDALPEARKENPPIIPAILLGGLVLGVGYVVRRPIARRFHGWVERPHAELAELHNDEIARTIRIADSLMHAPASSNVGSLVRSATTNQNGMQVAGPRRSRDEQLNRLQNINNPRDLNDRLQPLTAEIEDIQAVREILSLVDKGQRRQRIAGLLRSRPRLLRKLKDKEQA